jgi:hypothetical protein
MPQQQEQDQYVKLPDGSYGKFRSDATDADIQAAIRKDFPDAFNDKSSSLYEQGRQSYEAKKGNVGNPGVSEGAGLREGLGEWTKESIGNMGRSVMDFAGGRVARGGHELLTGLENLVAPAAVMVAPTALLATGRALAGGTVGGYLGKMGGEMAGLSPDQSDLAGDISGIAGGTIASGLRMPRMGSTQVEPISKGSRSPFSETAISSANPGGKDLPLPQARMGTPEPRMKFVEKFEKAPKQPPPKPSLFGEATPSNVVHGNASLPPAPERMLAPEPKFVEKFQPQASVKAEPLPQGKPSPFGEGAVSSASPGGGALQLPAARMGEAQPSARMVTKFERPVTKATAPQEGPAIVKSPKGAAGVPGRPEGRPATWTNERVRELAAWGDPAAIEQARLRGFGRIPLKYETAPLTPKEKFTFSKEGVPKRVE